MNVDNRLRFPQVLRDYKQLTNEINKEANQEKGIQSGFLDGDCGVNKISKPCSQPLLEKCVLSRYHYPI